MESASFNLLIIIFIASLLLALVIVATSRWHGRYSFDQLHGPQKIHTNNIPRIGGIAIFGAFALSIFMAPDATQEVIQSVLALGVIAFSFGLLEDLTKKVPVLFRLWATMIPGLLGFLLMDVSLNHFGIAWIDYLLQWPLVAVAFTAFAICGLTHAVNLIDGFNGLAAWTSIWISLGITWIALAVGDGAIAMASLILIAATLGFLLLNWPWGKLFLGDGGAYFLGMTVAWLSVLLVNHNPTVSPFAFLVLCAYPIIEALYSIARRTSAKISSGDPDSKHLHQLLSKLLFPEKHQRARWQNNAIIGFVLGSCSIIPMLLAIGFYQDQYRLIIIFMALAAIYVMAYKLISRSIAQRYSLETSDLGSVQDSNQGLGKDLGV